MLSGPVIDHQTKRGSSLSSPDRRAAIDATSQHQTPDTRHQTPEGRGLTSSSSSSSRCYRRHQSTLGTRSRGGGGGDLTNYRICRSISPWRPLSPRLGAACQGVRGTGLPVVRLTSPPAGQAAPLSKAQQPGSSGLVSPRW